MAQSDLVSNLGKDNFKNGMESCEVSPQKVMHQLAQTEKNMSDVLKVMDNFYMNYSNSPLSSERVVKDNSAKSTGRFSKEYDSFGDMVAALQKRN